jgi:hypothetical protein
METFIVETLTKIKPTDPLRFVKQTAWRNGTADGGHQCHAETHY